jgi:hypothetical protein
MQRSTKKHEPAPLQVEMPLHLPRLEEKTRPPERERERDPERGTAVIDFYV